MVAPNKLLKAPPHAVDQAIKRLGGNLRTARIRRGLTIETVAQRIGTGRRAVMDAEKGKVATSAAVYVALLWHYDLLMPFESLANPMLDLEGLALATGRERTRPRRVGGLDNDF